MRSKIALLAILAAGLVVSGCASVGNETLRAESESTVKGKMVEGKTTKAEVNLNP